MYHQVNIRNLNVTVQNNVDHIRLDKFLSQSFIELSRSRIKSLILSGHVTCGSKILSDPSRSVKIGERFSIIIPALKSPTPIGQKMDLEVVYEDNDLIVINKPAGLVVHPAAGNKDMTLVNALISHCGGSLSGIGGVARPGIVHRLDKDTSGLLVAAKNDFTHRGLAEQFADHSLDRAYKAIVWGVPKQKEGTIENKIGRSSRNRKKMAVVTRGGKHAITHYRVKKPIGEGGKFWASLVECRLETGRTHQIRVHMTSIGNAIIGDPTYGSKDQKKIIKTGSAYFQTVISSMNRQALHAYLIGFDHPSSGKRIKFKSDLPNDMKEFISI